MNAQNVIRELNRINPYGFGIKHNMKPQNASIVKEIFDLARLVEPIDKTKLDHIRELWLWTDRGSYDDYVETYKTEFMVTTIEKYFDGEEGTVDYESMKEQWPILFPEDTVWFRLTLCDCQDDHSKLISLNNRLKRLSCIELKIWIEIGASTM